MRLLLLLILSLLIILSPSAFAENEISISPDRSSYVVNEIVTISGTLDNSIAGGTVTSTITNPYHGGVIREKEITINDDYTFEDVFALDYRVWKFSGDYTYEIEGEQIVIKYNRINPTEIIIEFDKMKNHNWHVEYYYGEALHVTGEISQITEGNNIHVVIENDDDIYDEDYNKILDSTLTVNSDRTFSFDFDMPLDLWFDDDQDHRYEVKIYYGDYYGEKEFEYNHYKGYRQNFNHIYLQDSTHPDCVDVEIDCFNLYTITIPLGDTIGMTNADYSESHSFVSGVVVNGSGIPDGIFDSGELVGNNDYYSFTPRTSGQFPYYCSYHTSEQVMITVEDYATVISNMPSPITIQTDKDSYFNNQTVNLIIDISAEKIQDSYSIRILDPMGDIISYFRVGNLNVGNNNMILLPSNNNSLVIPGTYTVTILSEIITTFEYISNNPHWN